MRIHQRFFILSAAVLIINLYSCQKPAGPGGQATVSGKVYAYDWDNTQRYMISKGYCPGESVYICYGANEVVGKNVKSSTDGSFVFMHLNKGHYKVFVNSLDTSIKVKGNNTKIPKTFEFDITQVKQHVNLGDIIINK